MTIQVIQIHQIFLLLPEVEAAEEDEKVVEVPAEEVRVAETVKMVVMQVLQAAQPEEEEMEIIMVEQEVILVETVPEAVVEAAVLPAEIKRLTEVVIALEKVEAEAVEVIRQTQNNFYNLIVQVQLKIQTLYYIH